MTNTKINTWESEGLSNKSTVPHWTGGRKNPDALSVVEVSKDTTVLDESYKAMLESASDAALDYPNALALESKGSWRNVRMVGVR